MEATGSENGNVGSATLSMLNTTLVSGFTVLLCGGKVKIVALASESADQDESSGEEDDDEDDDAWGDAISAAIDDSFADLYAGQLPVQSPNGVVGLIVDDWIRFRTTRRLAAIVFSCRQCITSALSAYVANPATPFSQTMNTALNVIARGLGDCQPGFPPK